MANLADFSMLRWDVEGETVSVHRVVQEILRTRQDEPQAYLTAALKLLDTAIPSGNPADVRTWPAWEPLRPHVAFAVLEGNRLEIAVPTSRLMGELGTLLWGKALHPEAESLDRDALAMDEKHFGLDSTKVAVRLNNLAQLLKATNRLAEAEPLMRRALAIDEQSYGAEHPDVAIDLNKQRTKTQTSASRLRHVGATWQNRWPTASLGCQPKLPGCRAQGLCFRSGLFSRPTTTGAVQLGAAAQANGSDFPCRQQSKTHSQRRPILSRAS